MSAPYLSMKERASLPTARNMRSGLRQAVWNMTDGRCSYCGCQLQDDNGDLSVLPFMTIDHVVPTARGGKHVLSNFVPSCQPCNSRKGAR